ncbi:hypothetical protein ACIP98_29025 [Streptomyces sp. NPDC088354]|uniref:hypothetical protein n=1 Tax=Streptomyces sp. NPDC088354 TaxID=3365856 RepID=UPI0038044CBC
MTKLDQILDGMEALGANVDQARRELGTLRAVHDRAVKQLGLDYGPGDRVTITSDEPSEKRRTHGWAPFKDDLLPGRTGTAGEIRYDANDDTWCVLVHMDGPDADFYMSTDWMAKAPDPAALIPCCSTPNCLHLAY